MSTSIKNFKVEVVNIKKTPEDKNAENYVYCGRGSALGNPFPMGNYSKEERDRVCEEYEQYITKELESDNREIKDQLNLIWNIVRKQGSVKLGCFCAPQRCHCDTVKDILEKKYEQLKKKKVTKSKSPKM